MYLVYTSLSKTDIYCCKLYFCIVFYNPVVKSISLTIFFLMLRVCVFACVSCVSLPAVSIGRSVALAQAQLFLALFTVQTLYSHNASYARNAGAAVFVCSLNNRRSVCVCVIHVCIFDFKLIIASLFFLLMWVLNSVSFAYQMSSQKWSETDVT